MIRDRIEPIDRILTQWTPHLGEAFVPYRNHVYRVAHFCTALHGEVDDRIAIAAGFHDLGIWTAGTFDYLAPSIVLARDFLQAHGRESWSDDVALMIDQHHKLRSRPEPLVEAFRRADLIDVSWGTVKFGLPRDSVYEVQRAFPDAGFHALLLKLGAKWFAKHPLRPIPVLRW